MAKTSSIGVLQFISALVTVPVAVLSSIIANGNYSGEVVAPLIVMALIQVSAAVRLRQPDSRAAWSPAFLILPLASSAIFVLGSITQLGGAFAGERPTLVVVMSWALAILTIGAAVMLAVAITAKSAATSVVVLATVGAALSFSTLTYTSVFKYQEFTNADGEYRPSASLQACQDRLAYLQVQAKEELVGQGTSGLPGPGVLYRMLLAQADEQARQCEVIAKREQDAVDRLADQSITSSGSRLPLLYVAQITVLVDFAGSLLLLHFGGYSVSMRGLRGLRSPSGLNSVSPQLESDRTVSGSALELEEQSTTSTPQLRKAD